MSYVPVSIIDLQDFLYSIYSWSDVLHYFGLGLEVMFLFIHGFIATFIFV